MINTETTLTHNISLEDKLLALYPELALVEKPVWLKLVNQSQVFLAPPQTIMQTIPGPYDHFLLLIEGNTRVYQADENGREVTFYRNYPGNICPINLHNLFNTQDSSPYIQAETAIHALQVSARAFHQAIHDSDVFRKIIFSALTNRFCNMTAALEETVFKKLDSRLCLLLERLFSQAQTDTLKITHQQLANELGTTREVISRSLKQLEQQGCIKISRGHLTMVSAEKLSK